MRLNQVQEKIIQERERQGKQMCEAAAGVTRQTVLQQTFVRRVHSKIMINSKAQ